MTHHTHNPEWDIIGTKPCLTASSYGDLFAPPAPLAPLAPARTGSPLTSKLGAVDVLPRAGSQQWRLLEAFGGSPMGLIAEEAGAIADLAHTGYWKRVSELLRAGFLEDTNHTRPSTAGSDQRILRITAQGLRLLATRGAA